VQQGCPGSKITYNKDRFPDLCVLVIGIDQVVKQIGSPDAQLPEGIKKEDKSYDQESFQGKSARGAFRLEESVIKGP
jgi:hypothetical protein